MGINVILSLGRTLFRTLFHVCYQVSKAKGGLQSKAFQKGCKNAHMYEVATAESQFSQFCPFSSIFVDFSKLPRKSTKSDPSLILSRIIEYLRDSWPWKTGSVSFKLHEEIMKITKLILFLGYFAYSNAQGTKLAEIAKIAKLTKQTKSTKFT